MIHQSIDIGQARRVMKGKLLPPECLAPRIAFCKGKGMGKVSNSKNRRKQSRDEKCSDTVRVYTL